MMYERPQMEVVEVQSETVILTSLTDVDINGVDKEGFYSDDNEVW